MDQTDYFKLRKSQLKYCKGYPVYLKLEKRFIECNLDNLPGTWGVQVYIKNEDRLKMLTNVQKDFEKAMQGSNPVEIKNILSEMMVDTLNLPNPEVLDTLSQSFETFMDYVSEDKEIIQRILSLSSGRYSTVEHSINTAALTINFCLETGFSEDRTFKQFGLAGLFHDIGKAYIPKSILNASRKLTDEEFMSIKKHPVLGERILRKTNFSKNVCMGAAEHHLQLDGSGYPTSDPPKEEIGKLLGIIDPFEALTNHSRTYKDSHSFEKACSVLKREIVAEKLDTPIYKEFVKSLKVSK